MPRELFISVCPSRSSGLTVDKKKVVIYPVDDREYVLIPTLSVCKCDNRIIQLKVYNGQPWPSECIPTRA